MTPIVGKMATKKINQLVKAAFVKRSENSKTGIKMHVPMTPARTIGLDRPRGFGKA